MADKLVIRLKNAPSPSAIEALNEDFEDIITGDKIRAIEPMPEEQDEVATLNLQRIAFGFQPAMGFLEGDLQLVAIAHSR